MDPMVTLCTMILILTVRSVSLFLYLVYVYGSKVERTLVSLCLFFITWSSTVSESLYMMTDEMGKDRSEFPHTRI